MDPIEITEKAAVRLEEYKGNWSLVSCWKGRDDWKTNWCTVEFGKETKKKPLGVYLGDKATALKAIAALYHELKGDAPKPKEEPVKLPPVDTDSIPF